MNNKALEALIKEYGERICFIALDNGKKIFLNYARNFKGSTPDAGMIKASDFVFKTVGGVDMFGYLRTENPFGQGPIKYMVWNATHYIQQVIVMEPGFEAYCPDPLALA